MNRPFSLFLVFILLLISTPLPSALASDLISVSISSPADTSVLESGSHNVELSTSGAVADTLLELDGKILTSEALTLPKSMLTIGKHTLTAYAIGHDGTTAKSQTSFSVIKTVSENLTLTGINKIGFMYGNMESSDALADASALTAIKIYISETISATTLNSPVTIITQSGKAIKPISIAHHSSDNAIIATLPSPLESGKAYEVRVALSSLYKGASADDIAFAQFKTNPSDHFVSAVKFSAEQNPLLTSAQLRGKSPSVTVNYKNSTSTPKVLTAILSVKYGNTLTDIKAKRDVVPANTEEHTISLILNPLSVYTKGESISVMLIENGAFSVYKPTYKQYSEKYISPLPLTSIFDDDSKAPSLIGSAIIFKDDINSLFYGGIKQKYDSISKGYPYKSDNGTFMMPADVFEKAFSKTVLLNGSCVSIDDTTINLGESSMLCSGEKVLLDAPATLKENVLYLPLRSVAQEALGFTYLSDRGMHIFDTKDFPYTNSPSTYETKEPIDTIYRFMQFENKTAEDIYKKMDKHLGGNVHPRILTDSKSIAEIKTNAKNNAIVSEALTETLSDADTILTKDVQEYVLSGIRLLTPAREVMERLVTLSAAYLFTGNSIYPDRAWAEIENCFSWPDWNTSQHYLDNSELLYGISVAFDAFYDYFTNEQKEIIMDKTWELSLSHTLSRYESSKNFSGSEWRKARSNWGFVCNGAVIAAILAFGREGNVQYQPYYNYLLECALKAIEYPLMLYFPDGAWEEGLAYWEYSMRYLVGSALLPLYQSTGETFDFLTPEGVKNACSMGLYLQNGSFAFNFSDNGSENNRENESVYAMALLLGDDKLMQTWQNEMAMQNAKIGARTLLWYRPGKTASASSMPLDDYFRGVEAGSMKEAWHNQNGSCVFFKGGQNNTNGSHLDTGTFCFDSMGQRWSVDLGKDSYNIEGGYNGVAGYQLYAKRPSGHNCLVINPRADVVNEYYGGQYLNGRAEIKKMYSAESYAYSTVNLSDTYKYDTASYMRGFYFGDNRRTLLVQDEINLLEENSDIYWFMHTRAAIEIDDSGKSATLTKGGKKMKVTMLTNAENATFSVKSVGGENFQRFPTDPIRAGQLAGGSFTNVNVLTLNCKGSGNVYITVKLTPIDDKFNSYSEISYNPITNW